MHLFPGLSRLLIIACLLYSIIPASAQQFGGTPPSQKWSQIDTDTARIIFPKGLDSTAKRAASIVHYLAANQPASLGQQLRKINIVLQHNTVIGNGYVGLGPFRSEFMLTPVMDNFSEGSVPWTDQLALHEYRHVQQFNNFRNGLSKVLYYLSGEDGLALAINASVPDWFYEGDAVYNETILSGQGRGRLPRFLNTYPSLWQAGKNYSWMKLRNGSMKDYVPNHYNLGYLLVNYGREKYGTDFWSKVTQDASAFKGLFYPFQKAIKKHAGVDYKTFRNQAFESYKQKTARVSETRNQYLFPVQKQYVTSYVFPYSVSNDSLLYLKTSYRHRPAFYIKDAAGEHRLRVKDISIDEQFSYRNGKIVYASYESDVRWGWRDYSVIKLIDIQTRQQKKITHKSKYFTPDISPSGQRIAAIQVTPSGKSELHILKTENGEVVQAIRSSDIVLFTDPKFIDDQSLVTAVRLKDGKMALALAEISSGNTMRLTPPSYNVVGYPCVSNGNIFFTASYGGNDDVFALRVNDKKIFRITDGPLGNYYVNVGNGMVTWSAFTAEGYQLQQMAEKDIAWKEMTHAGAEEMNTKFAVAVPPQTGDVLAAVPDRDFDIKKYRKGTRLLNFHSWRPYYEDPIFTYSLYGENVLNTLQTEVYYLYNQNANTSAVGASAAFGALFPYLVAGAEYTFDRQELIGNNIRYYNQLDSRIGLTIPLNITSGTTFRNFSASSFYVRRNEYSKGIFKNSDSANNNLSYLSHSLSWSQQVQSAVQHIFPKLGYSLTVAHRHTISDIDAYQFYAAGAIYLPGVLSNHSLVLTGAIQQRDTLRAFFSDRIADARGYSSYYPYKNIGSRIWRLSANYHFPIIHPDWGFGNILYLQRIRGNVFYDMQRLFSDNKRNHADLKSFGGEIFVDTKWWNQYPLTFGVRISHLLNNDPLAGNAKGSNIIEFILPVSIIPR